MAALASDREIGSGKALIISILLSPLIGAIFVATSPKAIPVIALPREAHNSINSGDEKLASGDLDGALSDFEKVLTFATKNPNTNFKMSCIYSQKNDAHKSFHHLSRAVQDGFTDFQRILTAKELTYLREQSEFKVFAQNGYKFIDVKNNDDTISKVRTLGTT